MSDNEIKIEINEILKTGDIKIYSDEGELIELDSPVNNVHEVDGYNYIKGVEKDFRDNAGALLERLELSHLHINALKER